MEKSPAVRTQKHQLQFVLKVAAVCTDTRVVEHATINCSVSDVLVEATPLLDETLFQVVDVANPVMVDALLEHAPHLIVHGILVRAIGRPQQR